MLRFGFMLDLAFTFIATADSVLPPYPLVLALWFYLMPAPQNGLALFPSCGRKPTAVALWCRMFP